MVAVVADLRGWEHVGAEAEHEANVARNAEHPPAPGDVDALGPEHGLVPGCGPVEVVHREHRVRATDRHAISLARPHRGHHGRGVPLPASCRSIIATS